MATIPIRSYSDLKPIKFELADGDRTLDLTVPGAYSSQQGLLVREYSFLTSANDVKNKNYSTSYLTSLKSEANIFDLRLPELLNDTFSTTLTLSADAFLTISKNETSLSSTAFFSTKLEQTDPSQNFVLQLSSKGGSPVAQIYTFDGGIKKYLVQHTTNKPQFSQYYPGFAALDSDYDPKSYFNAIVDISREGEGYLQLQVHPGVSQSITFATSSSYHFVRAEGARIVIDSGDGAAATAPYTEIDDTTGSEVYTLSTMTFNFNNKKIDLNYYNASNNFVNYLTGADIDTNLSLSNQKYNFLLYSNYENNYLSGTDVIGELGYFNLKNHLSNDYNVNKELPVKNDKQVQRLYNYITNDENRETSTEDIKLNYNYFTTEYTFEPGKYTKFKLPGDMLPIERLNLNDAGFQKAGAYAAFSPYYSDRLYKGVDISENVNTANSNVGKYLCSWLYDDGSAGTWYDRYYFSTNTTGVSAIRGNRHIIDGLDMSLPLDQIFQQRASGLNYFDLESTQVLEPSGTYYYARIGKDYINNVIQNNNDGLVKENFTPRSVYDRNLVREQVDTLTLNLSNYDTFKFDVESYNSTSSVNITFQFEVPSLDVFKSHLLLGNAYNSGISIIKNFYYTPYIIIPQFNQLYFYDTDFNFIKSTSFPNIHEIVDVMYVSHFNSFVLRCVNSDRTAGSVLRTNIYGDIERFADSDQANLIGYTAFGSRSLYNPGERAIFKKNNENVVYDLDLYTLVASNSSLDNSTGGGAGENSVVRTEDTNVTQSMSGYRGVNLNDTVGAAISGDNTILFKNFTLGEGTYAALHTSDKIWDINAFDEKLYVQSGNKLRVFNTSRDLLSTYNLTTSAASGYKIDFVSEDYTVKPLVFSRASDYSLIIDKIETSSANTSGYIIKSYNIDLSGIDTGYHIAPCIDSYSAVGTTNDAARTAFANSDAGKLVGNFFNPVGLYATNQTFRNFENNLSIITKFDNEVTLDPVEYIWNDHNVQWNAGAAAGNWSVNFNAEAGGSLINNSRVLPLTSVTDGINNISINADLITGNVDIFNNGVVEQAIEVKAGIKALKNYLNNAFFIGVPGVANQPISDFVQNKSFAGNSGTLKNLFAYRKLLPEDMIRYHTLNNSYIDPIHFDIMSGSRNNFESIDTFYSYNIPSSISNYIKIYINDANLSLFEAKVIVESLTGKIKQALPINVTRVIYDFSIGNKFIGTIEIEIDTLSMKVISYQDANLNETVERGVSNYNGYV